jgi:hypothetical protein
MRLEARILHAGFLLVCLILCIKPAWAVENDPQILSEIEELNRQILLKAIAMEKYNIAFRRANNVQGRWRGWRYFVSQETDVSTVNAGVISQIAMRADIIEHPNRWTIAGGRPVLDVHKPKNALIETSFYPQIVGQSIGALGAAIELSINEHHHKQAVKAGYGANDAVRYMTGLKKDVARLFASRDAAAMRLGIKDLTDLEGAVLDDLVAIALFEFYDFYCAASRFRVMQNSLYSLDFSKKMVGVAGNIVNVYSLHAKRPHVGGTAGVLTFSSGALIASAPILARGAGKLAEIRCRKDVKALVADLEPRNHYRLETHCKRLADSVEERRRAGLQVSQKSLDAFDCYQEESLRRKEQLALATREIRAGTRSAQDNVIAGLLIGSTKMALGVTNMVAGWDHAHDPIKANRILAGGNITYSAGLSYAMGDNLRLRMRDEFKRRELLSRGEMPLQVLEKRAQSLDDLELQLRRYDRGL